MNWKNAYLESRILSADRLELISILYEHAIDSIHDAAEYLEKGDIRARAKAISKAQAVILELEGSLNHERGGEIAANLGRLYRYMRERLMAANLKQEAAPLVEVERLLRTVGEAWSAIRHDGVSAPAGHEEVLRASWPGAASLEASEAYSGHSWTA